VIIQIKQLKLKGCKSMLKFSSVNQALQYLSDYTGSKIRIAKQESKIVSWSEDADDYDDIDYDVWVAADQADAVMKKSGIRPDRNKELSLIALDNKSNVIGAVYDSYDHNEKTYSFDVAVLPEYRSGTGLKLIKEAIEIGQGFDYNITLWVVNPKLVKVLENKFDFEIETQHSDGSAHMIKS
jgi:hypothetical protein